jgi:hypothetical protein
MSITPKGPIHSTPGGQGPHLTIRDSEGKTFHVPYVGQTTLDMFQKPDFDPRPQFRNIVEHDLGYLDSTRAT